MKAFKGGLSSIKKGWQSSEESTSRSGPEDQMRSFDYFEDDEPLPQVKLHGYTESTKSRLLTPEICDEIRNLMPTRIQLYPDWHLLYSLQQHGASLHSLYDKVSPETKNPGRVGYILLIEDRRGGIFGAYCNEPFRHSESKQYYGNGECFLWKLEKVANVTLGQSRRASDSSYDHKWGFRGYPYTGLNQFVMYSTSQFLSMGAGDGHYGLWCDDGLVNGVSDPSLTFGNDVLSREGNKFHIVNLEVWRAG
ncbi:LANO_0E04434g1_1 [Lachancea nothofagi CBS 11611]|uniref:Oxidation resistance protein 1 n=1 Tax=Lachancea nothofagi CBS 11611 TaxID=1266666 RepID=A0A1G4JS38_9SACH|nr:LANO_0E04434g1_1 [Lachancea nothofagi CBS 11611]